MKLIFCFLIVYTVCTTIATAQKPITIKPDSTQIGNTRFPGFSVSIPEVKFETVKANWVRTIEKGTKSKANVRNNDMTLFGAIISDYQGGAVNIMSKAFDQDSICSLFVCFETQPDFFVGKDSPEFERLSSFLKKFAKEQYVNVAKEQLSAESDKLSELGKELKSVRKGKEKVDKDIQSFNLEIASEKDNITRFRKEIEVVNANIDNAGTSISSMEKGDARTAKEKELKKLEKKKKGLLKDISSAESNISKANTSIQDMTSNLQLNEAEQQNLNKQIVQQKLNVEKFEQKLKTIEGY